LINLIYNEIEKNARESGIDFDYVCWRRSNSHELGLGKEYFYRNKLLYISIQNTKIKLIPYFGAPFYPGSIFFALEDPDCFKKIQEVIWKLLKNC